MFGVGFIIGMFLTCSVVGVVEHFRSKPPILPPVGEVPFRNTRLKSKGSNLSFQAHHNPSRGGNA
jgi:hypothetical protein